MIKRYHIALVLLMLACAWQTHAAEVEAVIVYDHTSDLTRGYPFNDQAEPTQDYVGAGVTITLGAAKRFELDLTHGRKRLDGRGNAWESGSQVQLRFYPGRKR